MPLQTRWYTFRPHRPPEVVGVYELGRGAPTESGTAILYIGQGKIRDRLLAHARDDEKPAWQRYRAVRVCDRRRARQIERRELRRFRERHSRLPLYNHQLG